MKKLPCAADLRAMQALVSGAAALAAQEHHRRE